MSVEVFAIVITAASLFLPLSGRLFAGFAWILRRMDERFVESEASTKERVLGEWLRVGMLVMAVRMRAHVMVL